MAQFAFPFIFAHSHQNNENEKCIQLPVEKVEWKYLRCALEKRFKFDTTKLTNTNSIANNTLLPCNSFIIGYHLEDFAKSPFCFAKLRALEDNEVIKSSSDKIVLVRKPMPMGFDFYEPPKKENWMEKYKTENDALEAFVAQHEDQVGGGDSNFANKPMHASVFDTPKMPRPPESYQCWNCWKKGDHFRNFCQEILPVQIEDAKTIIKKPLPSGIPMTQFVKLEKKDVQEENLNLLGKMVYYDKDHNLYLKPKK